MNSAGEWSRRFALMYAAGVWTVFGYLASRSLHHTEKPKKKEEEEEKGRPTSLQLPLDNNRENSRTVLEEQKVETEEQMNKTVTYTSPATGFEITEKKINSSDFVAFPTRFYNLVQSLFNDSIKKEK